MPNIINAMTTLKAIQSLPRKEALTLQRRIATNHSARLARWQAQQERVSAFAQSPAHAALWAMRDAIEAEIVPEIEKRRQMEAALERLD